MEALENPPLPLSRAQRGLVWITAVAVALTRLLARSRTLWDWDEAQFALAVEEFDPPDHRPHPPGFPLFILAAKFVRLVAPSEFHAVQALSIVAAMSLFPLLFLLCRELRFPFETAYSGALLAVFLPNVWFYGGTAFSDVPSLALTAAACAALLRAVREPRFLLIGALLLGAAASIRPQALLFGFVPAVLAAWKWRSDLRLLVSAAAAGAALIAASYGGAALASSSVEAYSATSHQLREYLRQVDSFLSPDRPPLRVLFEFFFLRAIPGEGYATAVVYAALAGVLVAAVRREGRIWILLSIFLPFQVFAWLMLDYHSVTRYGVASAPMYAILAAAAVVGLVAWVPGFGRLAGAAMVIVFTAGLARWTMPVLTEVRRNPSPPASAMQWLETHAPADAVIYVHRSMLPFARLLSERRFTFVLAPTEMGTAPPSPGALVLTEVATPSVRAQRFVRGRGRLYDVVRKRYFDVTIVPAAGWAEFHEGWHGEEWNGDVVWHWMGMESRTLLPPAAGPASLVLRFAPVLEKGPPAVEVVVNGELVERFTAEGETEKRWIVSARSDGWNELVLRTDRVVNPAQDGLGADTRDLGLQLLGYDWGEARR